jgi:hypothetical protein
MTSQSFLDLLLQDAQADAFDTFVRDAEQRGLAEPDLDRLRHELVKALRVRAVLERRHRREVELAALNETAADLTALRDVELVLQAIVRRARQLLGTDVAYLTLIDDVRGDTYMRVTEGSVSPRFRRVRLPLGGGLGGLVAQTKTPYSSASYLKDPQFVHLTEVDSAVTEEGLTAILGVPLQLGDKVIGVLFAANRDERPFAREEVALLSSLAAHAAIAIENARLFQETEKALDELGRANTQIEAKTQALQRAAVTHEQLTDVVLRGGSLDEVTQALAQWLQGPIAAVDPEGKLLAAGGDPADDVDQTMRESGHAPADLRDATGSPMRTRQVRLHTVRWWVVPIAAGGDRLGSYLLPQLSESTEPDIGTVERAAQVTALLLLWRKSVADAEDRARGDFLDELFASAGRDAARLHRLADRMSIDLNGEHAIAVANVSGDDRRRLAAAAAVVAADMGGIAGEHAGSAVALLPKMEPEDAGSLLSRRLAAMLDRPVTVGTAGPARGMDQIVDAHAAAQRCARVLHALGRDGDSASVRQLGAYGMLFSRAGREDVAVFVESFLGQLLAYDQARGSDLFGTLAAFFQSGQNVSQAAQALHVHPNTFYQRLHRIDELLGDDWRSPENTLQTQLAVRLHELSRVTR